MNAGLEAIITAMSQVERAVLAAEVLNLTEPSEENLTVFFEALGDDVHYELTERAGEQEDREAQP